MEELRKYLKTDIKNFCETLDGLYPLIDNQNRIIDFIDENNNPIFLELFSNKFYQSIIDSTFYNSEKDCYQNNEIY